MARHLITASAQMGPISKSETRKDTVARLLAMMREAHGRGAKLVVFTELALTTPTVTASLKHLEKLDRARNYRR